jgi:L-seryl-tRNA(Ser) seleniumtransferase
MGKASLDLLRTIPSVTEVLASEPGRELTREFGHGLVTFELRALLDDLRRDIRGGAIQSMLSLEHLGDALRLRLARLGRASGRRAINATGILLHTGLGRAPLCREAIDAMAACDGYSVLQASLESGDRSLREAALQRMLIELTGCEAATVVNNNAAATMLILNTLAAGKEVVISRGQLIEIGGSFRMTDVMAQSSAVLREVGTTNRTHLRDYESAINERTGAIIHVHTSNYRIRGFASTPEVAELVELGRRRNIPVIDDLGSGALVPLREFGLSDEPLVRDSVAAGIDAACFSGDKLICGPQSGIICGRAAAIERIRKNPFARMFRVGKLTLAALQATLIHFLNAPAWRENLPLYRMLARPVEQLSAQARRLAESIGSLPQLSVSIADDAAYIGSGANPDEAVASKVVRLKHAQIPADELGRRLRMGLPSVFGRLQDRALVLDMRTVQEGELPLLIDAVRSAVAKGAVCQLL